MIYLDIFSGGGFAALAHQRLAGHTCAGYVEIDAAAQATLAPLPAGAVEAWVRAARDGSLWDAPPPMTCARGAEPRRAARIRQAGNGWVPLCAAVAFDLLSQDLGG